MKKHSLLHILVIILVTFSAAEAQKKTRISKDPQKNKVQSNVAIVVDERLALLLMQPSLYAVPVRRLSRGRNVIVLRSKQADGVTFYEVKMSPTASSSGWVQAEAVVGNFKRDDAQRLFELVQASDGFTRFERAVFFLEYFPDSELRPVILLLIGDLIEEDCLALSKRAPTTFDRREMAASGAPLHSFYLNYSGLDRYRKHGIRFLFNINTLSFHYDGSSWLEILDKFPKSQESNEAQRRLDFLREKMERKDLTINR